MAPVAKTKNTTSMPTILRESLPVLASILVLSVMKPANLSAPLTNCIELASRIGKKRPPFYTAGERRPGERAATMA